MKIKELQKEVDQWIQKYGVRYFDEMTNTAILMEEVGETVKAIAYKDSKGVMDGIGDCVVVLIVLAAQHDMTLEECLEHVWDEIKDRTGKLEDGLFKKD